MVDQNFLLFLLWSVLTIGSLNASIVLLLIAKPLEDGATLFFGISFAWLALAFLVNAIIRLFAPCEVCQHNIILLQRTAFAMVVLTILVATSIIVDAHNGRVPRVCRALTFWKFWRKK